MPAGQSQAERALAAAAQHQHPVGVRHVSTVQVDHPGSRPLTPSELALLESFRTRLHQRVSSVGLTVDDVRQLLKAMHEHPEASVEVIRILHDEASTLLPGQRLVSFDWD